jgi:hypothetical protein
VNLKIYAQFSLRQHRSREFDQAPKCHEVYERRVAVDWRFDIAFKDGAFGLLLAVWRARIVHGAPGSELIRGPNS